nr:uncharacterized protein LOC127342730 isoform X2 [Lolium perenne]
MRGGAANFLIRSSERGVTGSILRCAWLLSPIPNPQSSCSTSGRRGGQASVATRRQETTTYLLLLFFDERLLVNNAGDETGRAPRTAAAALLQPSRCCTSPRPDRPEALLPATLTAVPPHQTEAPLMSISFGATHIWTEGVARSRQDFELYKCSVEEKGFGDISKLQHQHLHGGYQRQKRFYISKSTCTNICIEDIREKEMIYVY